jgi:hypothetical protein
MNFNSLNKSTSQDLDFATLLTPVTLRFESFMVTATYNDELSAHRAKKAWPAILREYFYISERDFSLSVKNLDIEQNHALICNLNSEPYRHMYTKLQEKYHEAAFFKLATAHFSVVNVIKQNQANNNSAPLFQILMNVYKKISCYFSANPRES